MKRLIVVALLAMGALLIPAGASAERLPGADHGGAPFTVALASSVSDSNGSGSVRLTINPGQEQVCWDIHVSGLTTPITASHIHRLPAGQANGPVVVPFFNFATPSTATAFSGCASHNAINITTSERELLDAIIANPSGYYVNVHTTKHPAGEVRGQLVGP
jgi:CHRD domain-containing protein